MDKNKQCERLFQDIKDVAKNYSDMYYIIESLSGIVQNPDFMNPQDVYQWNQECKMVSDLMDNNLKDYKQELSRIYREVNKIYNGE
jgi:esterase/lipase